MDKISELSGIYPDTYSLNSYDAVQILGQAYDIVQSYNTELIRNVLPTVCSTYNYVGLSRKLNSSGDLETANYIFWTIKPGMGKYYWETYATYVAEGDYIRIK
jgi:ABC-type branched-subunit amino acid transport system substrate-binding protein